SNWNNAGSLLHITRVTTSTANITISTMYNSTTSVIAQSNFPDSYGNAGKKITINTYFNNLVAAKMKYALIHEMGHALGLTQTDGTFGALVSGTPTTETGSIMNGVCSYWTAFTNYDLLAFRTVYPK